MENVRNSVWRKVHYLLNFSVQEFIQLRWCDPNSYLLQCFQAVVYSQSITQWPGSILMNIIPFKTVEESTPELVEVLTMDYQ